MDLKLLTALAIASTALAADESKLTRQGDFWVQTTTGSEMAAPGGRLRISTRGPVTVRGGTDDQLQFTVTKRVKVRREEEARQVLRQFVVKTHRQGDINIIEVVHGGEGWGVADLSVTAPRSLRGSMLETHGGPVDAVNLNGSVQVQTGGGAIRLDRISGPVSAKTAGGEITLGVIGGSAYCTSAGGPIRAQSIRGEAVLETAGGDITAGEVGGPLRASTAPAADVQRSFAYPPLSAWAAALRMESALPRGPAISVASIVPNRHEGAFAVTMVRIAAGAGSSRLGLLFHSPLSLRRVP